MSPILGARGRLKLIRIVYLLIGLGLLALVLSETDLSQVWHYLQQAGWLGVAVVFGIFFIAFLVDTASWHLMLPTARLDATWLYRLWKVRMVGEALNYVIPAASLGGEPAKAVLLKKQYGIGYKEGGASVIMAKTVNLLALLAFAASGLVLISDGSQVPMAYVTALWIGLAALAAGVLGFFAVQRWRLASRLGHALSRTRFGASIERSLEKIQEVDAYFVAFYRDRPGRFTAALLIAWLAWTIGAVEIYVLMIFLGHPVSFAEAWVIEAVAQLVRAGSFFIPANLGAVEAGFVLIGQALTGQAALGLALAAVRRARDLVWILWGLGLGWRYSFSLSKA